MIVSKKGTSLTSEPIRAGINKRTKIAFGRSVNPHLFRDCLVTSLATDDPEAVLCVVPILGYASFKTMEQNYNQATMQTAARNFTSEIMQLRHEMLDIFELEDIRSFLVEAESKRSCQL